MQDATKTDQVPSSTGSSWPTSAEPIGVEEVRARQRQKILNATIELVAKRGFHNSSAERICKEAGVSFPTFRKHFRDKEDCFLAAFDEIVDGWRERAIRAAAEAETWSEQIAAGLAAILEAISEDPKQARICLVEALTAGPNGIDRYEDAARLCVPALRQGRAEMRPDETLPPLLEETIAGGVAWTVHQKVASGEGKEATALYGELVETVLAPYIGEKQARQLAATQPA